MHPEMLRPAASTHLAIGRSVNCAAWCRGYPFCRHLPESTAIDLLPSTDISEPRRYPISDIGGAVRL